MRALLTTDPRWSDVAVNVVRALTVIASTIILIRAFANAIMYPDSMSIYLFQALIQLTILINLASVIIAIIRAIG